MVSLSLLAFWGLTILAGIAVGIALVLFFVILGILDNKR